MSITILAIESSCDDTSAAVVKDGVVLSNEMATQDIHQKYGGVIPELASRAHQQNIVPVVHAALKGASITKEQIDAVAFTRGPGLLGSLLVGTSFAKGFAMAIGKPLIDVNHLQGHLLSHFIKESDSDKDHPEFPYLTLLVSGGHTQIVRVENFLEFEVIGETIDDAVGEAFDKCAKLLNLGYPGGPVVDKLALSGDPMKFRFSKPRIAGLNYSFSGIKTSLLYFLRDNIKENNQFVDENINDICASYQRHLVDILMEKLIKAANEENIKDIALSGGVSANSLLRKRIFDEGLKRGWKTFIPEIKYTTDNAAMIAIAGYYKFVSGYRAPFDIVPVSRSTDYR
ncbi:MAG: tRNA (adenosine(37)-N6)-threonylcarbamoyltransferase complex transferase subunit TsaD [Bacteroidales bacterium]|nr:tRNA (adenosine(37)-N6)-threonylcarbamoyltransferase complex transferase subunit TsaD [Bacteroidales bacterium]